MDCKLENANSQRQDGNESIFLRFIRRRTHFPQFKKENPVVFSFFSLGFEMVVRYVCIFLYIAAEVLISSLVEKRAPIIDAHELSGIHFLALTIIIVMSFCLACLFFSLRKQIAKHTPLNAHLQMIALYVFDFIIYFLLIPTDGYERTYGLLLAVPTGPFLCVSKAEMVNLNYLIFGTPLSPLLKRGGRFAELLIVSAIMVHFSKRYSCQIDFKRLRRVGGLPLMGVAAYVVLVVLPLLVWPSLMGTPIDYFHEWMNVFLLLSLTTSWANAKRNGTK